jgi:competence protein ComEC
MVQGRLLIVMVIIAAVVVFAGCVEGETSVPTPSPTATPLPKIAPAPTPTQTPTPKSTPSPSPTAPTGANPRILEVQFDAPGIERDNLNGEWVKIKNIGNIPIDMSGWKLSDEQNHVYNFPNGFELSSGTIVKIHTGTGTNTQTELYWGEKSPIWNNDGDTATLKDKKGGIIDQYSE